MDTGDADVFVWVGKEASIDERKNGMAYAHVRLFFLTKRSDFVYSETPL